MRGLRILYVLTAAVLVSGCFKKVTFETEYVLKPQVQELSGDPTQSVTEVKVYAFDADTADYTVASYEDALNGVLTRRTGAGEQVTTPSATGEPYEMEGAEGWLRMRLTHPTQMIVAVDPTRRLYAYTQQEISETLSKLYVTLIFKPWREGNLYTEGNWQFYNEFYVPPVALDCFISPQVEPTEGAPATPVETVKIYAYAVDTTSWRVASYDDAAAGVITSKDDPNQTRSNPNFQAYLDLASGNYRMSVTATQLMLVVVDRTNRLYAYTQRTVDLSGSSPTYPLLFRPWRQVWIERDETNDWVTVNPAYAPETAR